MALRMVRFLTHSWSSWLPSLWLGVFALRAGVNPAIVKKVCSYLAAGSGPPYHDLGSWVLLDDVFGQADSRVSPLAD